MSVPLCRTVPTWVISPTDGPSDSVRRRRAAECQQFQKGHWKEWNGQQSTAGGGHDGSTHRMIFQSSREAPGGGTAARPSCDRPSVFTHVTDFSVYAAAGKQTSASDAPKSPW